MAASYDLDLFMSSMFKAQVIPATTLGMSLHLLGTDSTFTFGGYDNTYVTDESKITWTPVYSTTANWW